MRLRYRESFLSPPFCTITSNRAHFIFTTICFDALLIRPAVVPRPRITRNDSHASTGQRKLPRFSKKFALNLNVRYVPKILTEIVYVKMAGRTIWRKHRLNWPTWMDSWSYRFSAMVRLSVDLDPLKITDLREGQGSNIFRAS